MTTLFNALFFFLKPVIIFFVSVGVLVSFLLGALANPQGWMNSVVCTTIDVISAIFPSTPDELKIGSLISAMGANIPIVGSGIIKEVFTSIVAIATIALVIKIYKLIPFKAS